VPFYTWFVEQKPTDLALEAARGRAYFQLAYLRSEMGNLEALLAGAHVNFGLLCFRKGDTPGSLASYAKAIELLQPILQAEPRLVTAQRYLQSAQRARASALEKQKMADPKKTR
jgi:hypothetical protein